MEAAAKASVAAKRVLKAKAKRVAKWVGVAALAKEEEEKEEKEEDTENVTAAAE